MDALKLCQCCSVISDEMEEITFMIGDNFAHMISDHGNSDNSVEKSDDRMWSSNLATNVNELCLNQSKTKLPKVNVFLHCKTQEAKEQMMNKMYGLRFKVRVDIWGSEDDSCQKVAEMKCWIQGMPLYNLYEYDWSIKSPLGQQWCGCLNIKGRIEQDVIAEDVDWQNIIETSWEDYSDLVEHWNPMQRLAFSSDENHHFSQKYIDQPA